MKRLLILFFLLSSVCTVSYSNTLISPLEDSIDSLVKVLNDKAITLCKTKKYEESEKTFKQLFKTKDAVIPDEAAYYFGVTSFFLKKYTQSRKAFVRFETLKKASDSLKKESVEFRYDIDCYEKGYYEYLDTCGNCHGKGLAGEDCPTCKGNGRQYCPNCSGSGVAVSRTSMGDNYSTCSKCGGKGVVDCLTCKGTLKVNRTCKVCNSKGVVKMKGACSDE